MVSIQGLTVCSNGGANTVKLGKRGAFHLKKGSRGVILAVLGEHISQQIRACGFIPKI